MREDTDILASADRAAMLARRAEESARSAELAAELAAESARESSRRGLTVAHIAAWVSVLALALALVALAVAGGALAVALPREEEIYAADNNTNPNACP